MKYALIFLVLSFQAFAVDVYKKEGILLYEYGDGLLGDYITRYHLQIDEEKIALDLSDAFMKKVPIQSWLGKRVQVQSMEAFEQSGLQRVHAIKLIENVAGSGVSGSQPWISILCKFSDVADEPDDEAYFEGMYANSPGGLDHYWREVSYNNINVAGSTAVDWVDLPSSQNTYVPDPGNGTGADLDLLFDDCTSAADALVDYSDAGNGQPYAGINMMFNEVLDCCAWGGGQWETLDGVQKVWRVTWEPPWSYSSEGVIAHEMGHGFGLPHANNSDGDSNPYDSPWDVMSSATGYSVTDNIYGRLGKHINMYYKYYLGWVEDSDGFTAAPDTNVVKRVNWTALTTSANEKFVRIPVSDGTSYFIEARKKTGEYEANLPGTAVIIHHVDTGRQEPPWVVDADNPAADYADTEGVMWKEGEVFVDPIDGYKVEILNQVTNGFRVRIIGSDDLIFWDEFE